MIGRNKFIAVTVFVLLSLAAIAGAITFPGFGKTEKVQAANGVVTIPIAKVSDGKAHYFKLNDGGKDITFFVVKTADGSLKTAFDACDACYREKKGYEQQGNMMICKNCNMKFAISKMGPNMTGGCNPSYLPHKLAGSSITIGLGDLKSGARFF